MFIHVRFFKVFFWACLLLGAVLVAPAWIHPASAEPSMLRLLVPPPVVNDDFDDALVIATVPYSYTQDILGATVSVDDPSFPCYAGQRYNTVWYRYTPTTTSTLILSRDGSQYSTVLGVWTGTRGSLTNQACSTASQALVTLNAGVTYYIEIARSSDYIVPAPTTMLVVFSVYPADTMPANFGKVSPANGAPYQSTRATLNWDTSTYAASYAYCFDTSDNDECDASWLTASGKTAVLSGLTRGTTYYWQVRATNVAGEIYADSGTWWQFTTASDEDLNAWVGTVSGTTRAVGFDVLQDGTLWLNFAVTVPYNGCNATGTSKITVGGPGAIVGRTFSFSNTSGSLRFTSTFASRTTASGTYTLSNYPICVWTAPGYCCWAATSGSGIWTASGPALPGYEVYLPLALRQN